MYSFGGNLKNICRCCHLQGVLKNIFSDNYHLGHKENYENMLKETFNINIIINKNSSEICAQICDSCILKLRDALAFKNMVIANEQKLSSYFVKLHSDNDKELQYNVSVNDGFIKSETLKIESNEDLTVSNEQNNILDYDSISIKNELECDEKDRDDTINRKRKSEHRTKKPKRKKFACSSSDKIPDSGKDWIKIAERRGRGPILRENSLKLLSNSTMFVFQWNKSRYTCFCCKQPFMDMCSLREHSNKEHSIQNIEKKIITQQNRLLKVEISSLNCKKCKKKLNTINDLRQHLIQNHEIKFDIEEDLLIPFKIQTEGLKCQICSETFRKFRLLNMHVNKHFKNHVCHICGASFTNLVFLNLHKTRSHKTFNCIECDVTFPNRTDKKNHDRIEHNVKFERKLRFPCPNCDERFFQENFKIQHLVEKHGMLKPEYKCSLCVKVFITKSLCNNHIKNVHMKEKKHECDICHNLFYTKSDVTRHRVTHTGEKKFSCSLCNSPFSTRDSLRRHMKRTHEALN
ncbi:zinc finger protein 39-like [Nymphalis io]|uniref:zinc finger protein 39-like n=1 Tax=Inachis io TaxID=171585 RepID=UPI00216976BB|nr:zinc finger protein 39-like [Nymphalis io]